MSHPPYAARWISQWRSAAVELQRVRDAELRQSAQPAGEDPGSPPVEAQSGLVQQQAWFRRWHLLPGAATGGPPDSIAEPSGPPGKSCPEHPGEPRPMNGDRHAPAAAWVISDQLWHSAVALQLHLQQQGFKFCFIGGIALQRWGEPRMTRDLDLTLLTGFGNEQPYIDYLLKHFAARVEDAEHFALRNRVLLLRDDQGTPIDIALGAMPFEARTVERSSRIGRPDETSITTCSAEDLIVHKAFAARAQDWIDIRGILVRNSSQLDRQLILDELTPLVELKEEPEILTQLMRMVEEVTE